MNATKLTKSARSDQSPAMKPILVLQHVSHETLGTLEFLPRMEALGGHVLPRFVALCRQ